MSFFLRLYVLQPYPAILCCLNKALLLLMLQILSGIPPSYHPLSSQASAQVCHLLEVFSHDLCWPAAKCVLCLLCPHTLGITPETVSTLALHQRIMGIHVLSPQDKGVP